MKSQSIKPVKSHRRRAWHALALLALLALPVLVSACSGNEHMYKHKRSDCDCPRFD